MAVELGKHQLNAIREMKPGCIVKGGVGTGKTRTALVYFLIHICGGMTKINGVGDHRPMKTPTNLIVITTAKKRDDFDWEKEMAAFALEQQTHVTVDSWNNIQKYKDVKDSFFIFDEQRLVGYGAWSKAFIQLSKQNRWIMLSATPGDNWFDYMPVFIANGFYKNKSHFVEDHVIYEPFSKFPKVRSWMLVSKLERLRDEITVEMPYERFTKRHIQYVDNAFDKQLFDRVVKDRWNPYEERPIRDKSELFMVMRKVVNSDPSRLDSLKDILEKHPKLIVFYNFNYELESLRTLATSLDVKSAEWNGQKHQPIPESKSWLYLVQYTAGAEGWNCISTDAMVFYSLNYSWKINEQAQGRIDRLNTPFIDLYYYIFKSKSQIDAAVMKSLKVKKNFNENNYAKDTWLWPEPKDLKPKPPF